jgi:hypothetical protein
MCGFCSAPVVAAEVVTVAVPLPVLSNDVLETVHFGVSADEFAGAPEFSVQLPSLIVVEKLLLVVHVIVEVAELPRLTPAGVVAASVNVDCVTVTFAVPLATPYVASPA